MIGEGNLGLSLVLGARYEGICWVQDLRLLQGGKSEAQGCRPDIRTGVACRWDAAATAGTRANRIEERIYRLTNDCRRLVTEAATQQSTAQREIGYKDTEALRPVVKLE